MATEEVQNINDIEIKIPSDLVFERVVRESAVVVARHLGFSEERVSDLQLAVSEAVTNAIEHGNNGDTKIKVGVKFFTNRDQLGVQVTDQGRWENAENILVDVPEALDMEDRLEHDMTRGMGMFLISQLADNTELKSSDKGTEFTMWFNIERGPNNANSMNIALQGPELI